MAMASCTGGDSWPREASILSISYPELEETTPLGRKDAATSRRLFRIN